MRFVRQSIPRWRLGQVAEPPGDGLRSGDDPTAWRQGYDVQAPSSQAEGGEIIIKYDFGRSEQQRLLIRRVAIENAIGEGETP